MPEPNYARIDGSLLLACEKTPASDRVLSVFVHLHQPATGEQTKELADLGVRIPSRPKRILTATLSPDEVKSLSQQEWIKSLKLSHRLKALPED